MRVSFKALFFGMYKLPPRDQWIGPDGICTKIATDLCCSAQTLLKIIMQLDDDDLDVAARASGSGGHKKKISLSTAAEYNKKLENLLKEKRDYKTGPKGGKYSWAEYDGNKPYQDFYGDDWHQHLQKTFKWNNVIYYNIK